MRTITIAGFIGALGISYPLYSSFQQSASLTQDSISYVTSAQRELNSLKDEVSQIASRPTEDEKKIRALESEIQNLKRKVADLTNILASNPLLSVPTPPVKHPVPKDAPQ